MRLLGDSLTNPWREDSISSQRFNNSYIAADGSLYFLGDEGVNRVTSSGVEEIEFTGIESPEFLDMFIDEQGRQLYATSRGLIIKDGDKQTIIDMEYGLRANRVQQIVPMDSDKYLLMQRQGFVILEIDRLMEPGSDPYPLRLNQLFAGEEKVELKAPAELSPKQRNLRFLFNLNDFRAEARNKYNWYLEGLEEGFGKISDAQQAGYQRLPQGQYRFHLQARDAQGMIHTLNPPFEFRIMPYFWETIVFRVFAVLGAFSSIYLFVLWRMRQVKHANIVLEEKVEKRTMELMEAREDIKQLTGLLPICAGCKKIRDDAGFWQQVEVYISHRSEAEFSHSMCPECLQNYYPEYYGKNGLKRNQGKGGKGENDSQSNS